MRNGAKPETLTLFLKARVSPSLMEKLDALAKQEGRTRSNQVVRLLQLAVEKELKRSAK